MTQIPVVRHRQLVPFAFAALTACTTPDASPTSIAPSATPLAAKPSSGSASYAVTDLGTAGYLESVAHDVNDAGIVVGQLNSATGIYGFARVGGKIVLLPTTSNRTVARAVSNGSTTYVVGFANPTSASSQPVRWTIDGTTISAPEYLALARSNIVTEVNDHGSAIGPATIWGVDGAVAAEVNPPDGFTTVELTDINNGDLVTLRASNGTGPDRGYIRLPDGAMVVLAPPPGMEAWVSQAAEVSEQQGDVVYVAGYVWLDGTNYAARWTFDVAARAVTALTLRTERISRASGVSDAGTLTGGQGAYETMAPYAWRLDGTAIGLPVPKGGKQGYAAAVSPNGKLMTGTAQFNGSDAHALLWSGGGP